MDLPISSAPPERLLSVADALARLLNEFAPLEPETIPLSAALGRVLSENVLAPHDLPSFSNSSMDGYAVHAVEVEAASREHPIALPVLADIQAGGPIPQGLPSGFAARITTGAPMPPDADAVVPVEWTNDEGNRAGSPAPKMVEVRKPVSPGHNVRRAGEDLRAGEVALTQGTLIRPQEVGLLAALGRSSLQVVRQPRVGVLSTGNELVGVDAPLAPGKIRDVNGQTLPALITGCGGLVHALGVASDSAEAVASRLDEAVQGDADLLITSAGVSVGAFDYVRTAVERAGKLDFWKVNMRPGKPVTFGRYRGIPFLGLPGNPVSALVSFEVFARPCILRLGGARRLHRPTVTARLLEPVQSDGRESYLRGVVEQEAGGYTARLAGGQGSAMLSSLVRANALLIVPAGVHELAQGSSVKALMLDWPGGAA